MLDLGQDQRDRGAHLVFALAGRRQIKVGRPKLRREAVACRTSHYGISQRRACRLIKQPRSHRSDVSRKDPGKDLRQRMREIANTRIRHGHRRVHVLLKREGWLVGRSQADCLHREVSGSILAAPVRHGPWTSWRTNLATVASG